MTGCAPVEILSFFLGHLQHFHFIVRRIAIGEDLCHHSLVLAGTSIADCPYLESQTAGHLLNLVL